MALKDENIEWTESSLELQSNDFEPIALSTKQRIEMTKLLQTDWAEDDSTGIKKL